MFICASSMEGGHIGHVPDAGFVSGVRAVGAVMLSNDHFVLLNEGIDPRNTIPVKGDRMAIRDDIIRLAVDANSAPFAIKEVEVESLLLDEGEAIPSLNERAIKIVLTLRIDEFHKAQERFIQLFIDHVIQGFHKNAFFGIYKINYFFERLKHASAWFSLLLLFSFAGF